MTLPRPLTIAEVAERWQCSRDTVEHRIKTGKLKCLKLGPKLTRVTLEQIAEYEQTVALDLSHRVGEEIRRESTGASSGQSEGPERRGRARGQLEKLSGI